MLKDIIKVIALGLGLSVVALVPSATAAEQSPSRNPPVPRPDQPATNETVLQMLDNVERRIERTIRDNNTGLQRQIRSLDERVSRLESDKGRSQPRDGNAPPPAVRLVHIHRHYYPRYWPWCPPPWFVEY
jgi:hypothetical protein